MRDLQRSLLPRLGAVAAACVLLTACSEGTVSAPQGGAILLEASPAAIGLGGESQITALVRDQNGNPVRGDVEVLFFTDLGSIDRAARTSSQGLATATLEAGNTPGTATVRAVAGPNENTIGVPIGTQVGGITLQATPDDLPDSGGEVELLAEVLDSDQEPLVGATVTFSTPLGTFESGSDTDTGDTDESGEARARLTVTGAEIDSWDRSSFRVTATTPGPDGAELEAFVDVELPSLAVNAQFSVESVPGSSTSVQFVDESTPPGSLNYAWDFESDDTDDSNAQNPVHDYQANGTYDATLRVSSGTESDVVTQPVTVPVPEP